MSPSVVPISEVPLSHYLVSHDTTHQPDGVHVEAHYTCGEKLEGVGQNENAVMSALWARFEPRKLLAPLWAAQNYLIDKQGNRQQCSKQSR
jgi:hypothetical protein